MALAFKNLLETTHWVIVWPTDRYEAKEFPQETQSYDFGPINETEHQEKQVKTGAYKPSPRLWCKHPLDFVLENAHLQEG